MRICVQKSTGKLIEGSSHSPEEILLQNAQNTGYAANDIEVQTVTKAEFAAILERTSEAERTYQDRRRSAYPPMGDQLEDLFKAGRFSPEMTARIQAVKDRFPKPGGAAEPIA